MTLDQLNALVWVARLRAFGAAAEKLNTTQPGVSNRIRSLENELGVSLFERTTRSVRLTQKGRKCLKMAERILELATDIKTSVSSKDQLTGSITIGVSHAIAMTWLPALMARLNLEYPRLEVDVETGATKSLFERLSTGDVELLICGGIPLGLITHDYVVEGLGYLNYSWMTAADDDRLPAGGQPLKPVDLQSMRIIAYTKHSYLNEVVSAWFRQNGAQIGESIRCDELSTIASLVSSGLGVGFLPASLFEDRIARGELRTLATTPPISGVHHYTVYLNSPDTFFPRLVAEIAKEVDTFSAALPV